MEQEKVWDEIASDWNKFRVGTPDAVKEFLIDKKGEILDVGCGSGRNFVKVDGLFWSGIDFSKEMLELAEETANGKNMEVELKKSECWEIPFEDNSFDSVLCFAVMHCVETFEQREKCLKEIYRVLKPDSQVFLSTWGSKSPKLKNKNKECFVKWTSKDVERYTYVFEKSEFEDLVKSVEFEIEKSWEDFNINVICRK